MNKKMTRDEIKQKIENEDDFVLLEVLSEEQFNEFHLPGAINIPFDNPQFRENVQKQLPDKDQEMVVYCLDTACNASGEATRILADMGYKNAYDYVEGKNDWKEAGYEIEKADAA